MSSANDGYRTAARYCRRSTLVFVCTVSMLIASGEEDSWRTRLDEAKAAEQAGSFNRAEELLRSTLSTLPDQSGLPAVVIWNEIGTVSQALAKFKAAEQDYQHALSINQALQRLNDVSRPYSAVEMAISLNNIGAILQQRQEFGAAEAQFRRALQLAQETPSQNNPALVSIVGNLATALKRQGRLTEAEPLYSRALRQLSQTDNKSRAEQARLLTKFSFYRFETAHYPEALELAKQANELERSLPTMSGVERAATLRALGLALFKLGQVPEAESAFHQALDLRNVNPHPDSDMAEELTNLAVLEKQVGRITQAQQHISEALQIAERLSPADNALIAKIWGNEGGIAVAQKRYRQASELYHKAADYFTNNGGVKDPDYAAVLSGLANLEQKLRHYKRAQALYEQALQSDKTALGPNNTRVAFDLSNVGAQLCFQKRCEEAIPFYQQAEAIQESALGPNSPDVAWMWRQLGLVYLNLKRFGQADLVYQRALHIWNSAGQNNADLMLCLREYAFVCRKQNRFGDAEQAEVQALGIQVRSAVQADREARQISPSAVKGFRFR